jgi:methanol metabolism-related c-type cytochrome
MEFNMRKTLLAACLALAAASATASAAADTTPAANTVGDPKVASSDDGKYFDANGNPTYNIGPDDKVDWYTFSGYRRFNGSCEVCHGFDGSGSSFAPDLTQSLKTIDYNQFQNIVINGKQDVNTAVSLVMPAFGDNKNVMCYLDDIYVYLRARADGAQPGGRPTSHEDKPKTAIANEDECMGP